MTVVLTAAVYSVSFVPITIYFIVKPFVKKAPEPGPFYLEFYRVAVSAMNFNVLANFFVYSLTVTSFRNFLKTQFQQKVSSLSNMITPAGKVPLENLRQKLYHVERPQPQGYSKCFKPMQ